MRLWSRVPVRRLSALQLGYRTEGLRYLRRTPPEVLRALGDRLTRYERACAQARRSPLAQ